MIFETQSVATEDFCEELSRLDPINPCLTWPYVQALAASGSRIEVVGLSEQGRWQAAAVVALRTGRLNRSLELSSLPSLPHPERFWTGFEDYCERNEITQLAVGTFGSPATVIPPLPGETTRCKRSEFVIRLPGADLVGGLSTLHRRMARKGERGGLVLRRSRTPAHCEAHFAVNQSSMARRRGRAEAISELDRDYARAAVASGAAEIFQAVAGAQVHSSILVLRAPRSGYLFSSGTSPEGMKIGASHYLNLQIASTLQADGCEVYNLGGCSRDEEGLWTYKSRFGGEEIRLEGVECHRGPKWKKLLMSAWGGG